MCLTFFVPALLFLLNVVIKRFKIIFRTYIEKPYKLYLESSIREFTFY